MNEPLNSQVHPSEQLPADPESAVVSLSPSQRFLSTCVTEILSRSMRMPCNESETVCPHGAVREWNGWRYRTEDGNAPVGITNGGEVVPAQIATRIEMVTLNYPRLPHLILTHSFTLDLVWIDRRSPHIVINKSPDDKVIEQIWHNPEEYRRIVTALDSLTRLCPELYALCWSKYQNSFYSLIGFRPVLPDSSVLKVSDRLSIP